MNPTKNMSELIALVASVTPLTPNEYPALAQLSGAPKEHFIVGHSIRHLSVSTGYMQKAIENAEHGGALDKEMIKRKLFSAGFSICKLCEVLDISGEEFMAGVAQMAKDYK